MKRRGEAIEQIAIAGDRAGVEQRQQKLRIVRFDPGEVAQLADLMSDHEPEIPQRLEELSEPSLVLGVERAGEQHEQVDVRMEAEVTPAVSAQPEDDGRWRVARARRLNNCATSRVDGGRELRQRQRGRPVRGRWHRTRTCRAASSRVRSDEFAESAVGARAGLAGSGLTMRVAQSISRRLRFCAAAM